MWANSQLLHQEDPTIHHLLASAVWMLRWWWTTGVKAVVVAVMEATGCGAGGWG